MFRTRAALGNQPVSDSSALSRERQRSHGWAIYHLSVIDSDRIGTQNRCTLPMVSVLSHEIGEWADDPLTLNYNGNNTPCGILEVGDPLEGNPNYGAHPYKLNRFTYNLQDLVTLPYFGAPIGTSVNGWLSFQDASLSICSNGAGRRKISTRPALGRGSLRTACLRTGEVMELLFMHSQLDLDSRAEV